MKLTLAEVVTRWIMWGCLLLVGAGAAVLSFHGLRDLGQMARFGDWSWALPIVIDIGALAATLVWLSRWAPPQARSFGELVALVLLTLSVAGNGISHVFIALNPGQTPVQIDIGWALVVAVSAIPPLVLAAVVHLAVLTGGHRPRTAVQARPRATEQASVRPVNTPKTARTEQGNAEQDSPSAAKQTGKTESRPVALSDPNTVQDFLEWAATLDHTPSTYEVRQRMGCGHNRALKLLDELDRATAKASA